MANLSGALSNFGLTMQGFDAAQMEQERIRNARQYNDLDQLRAENAKQGIEAQKQAGVLRGQQIEEGRMGLEETTREREKAKTIREAGARGSFIDMAFAAEKAGDPELAFKYRQVDRMVEGEGLKNVVDLALKNPQPGYRPDLGEEFNRYGKGKVDPQSVTLDTNGNLSYQDPKINERASINVGVTAERLGMVKPPAIHNIPAGGVGVITQPGRPTQFVQTPKTFPEHPKEGYIVKKIKDSEGNEREQIIDVRPNSPNYGKEVAPSEAGIGTPTDRSAGKVLPEVKAAMAELEKIPGMATKSDPTNPLDTHMIYTEKGAKLAPVVSGLIMADRKLAAHEAILVAMNGERGVDADGNRAIKYGNKIYKMSDTAGTRLTPAPAQPKPTAMETLTKELKENEDNLAKAQKDSDLKKISLLTANIIQLKAEIAKITKPIKRVSPIPTEAVTGYNKGGKVSKHQGYGLGA